MIKVSKGKITGYIYPKLEKKYVEAGWKVVNSKGEVPPTNISSYDYNSGTNGTKV